MSNEIKKRVMKIILLYLANQFGKNISKLSIVESEYLLAIIVNGQTILKATNTAPSSSTKPIATHVKVPMRFFIPQNNT